MFLAKSRRFVFEDLLFEKLSIPTVDEEIDEGIESLKKSMTIELNEIALYRTYSINRCYY
jgi:hypothetical protein